MLFHPQEILSYEFRQRLRLHTLHLLPWKPYHPIEARQRLPLLTCSEAKRQSFQTMDAGGASQASVSSSTAAPQNYGGRREILSTTACAPDDAHWDSSEQEKSGHMSTEISVTCSEPPNEMQWVFQDLRHHCIFLSTIFTLLSTPPQP